MQVLVHRGCLGLPECRDWGSRFRIQGSRLGLGVEHIASVWFAGFGSSIPEEGVPQKRRVQPAAQNRFRGHALLAEWQG